MRRFRLGSRYARSTPGAFPASRSSSSGDPHPIAVSPAAGTRRVALELDRTFGTSQPLLGRRPLWLSRFGAGQGGGACGRPACDELGSALRGGSRSCPRARQKTWPPTGAISQIRQTCTSGPSCRRGGAQLPVDRSRSWDQQDYCPCCRQTVPQKILGMSFRPVPQGTEVVAEFRTGR